MYSNINTFNNENINNSNNSQNNESLLVKIKNYLLNFYNNITFSIKLIITITIIFYILNLFLPISYIFSNITYYSIYKIQIWRFITGNFIITNLINIIFAIIFWVNEAIQYEKKLSTIKYFLHFLINSTFIQIIYSIFQLFFSLFYKELINKKKNNFENNGIWPYILFEISLMCLLNPDNDIYLLCIPYPIPAKYFPLVLILFLFILNMGIELNLIIGVLYSFIYVNLIKNKMDLSDESIEKIENSFLFNHFKDNTNFIKLNNVNNESLLNNNNNQNGYDLNSNNNNFIPFSGTGIKLGGN